MPAPGPRSPARPPEAPTSRTRWRRAPARQPREAKAAGGGHDDIQPTLPRRSRARWGGGGPDDELGDVDSGGAPRPPRGAVEHEGERLGAHLLARLVERRQLDV